jgi:hypothetical protein
MLPRCVSCGATEGLLSAPKMTAQTFCVPSTAAGMAVAVEVAGTLEA